MTIESLIATKQTFSHMVEEKRFRRTLPAVVNGVSAGQAISDGIVEPEAFENEAEEEPELDADTEDNSLFFPEEDSASTKIDALQSDGKTLNPTANLFQPKANSIDTPKSSSIFGAPALTPGLAFPRLSSTSSQDSVFGPSSITSKPSAVTAAPLPSALPQPSSTTSPWSLQSFDTASDQRLSSFDRTLSTKLTSTPASGATPTTSTVSFTPAFLRETPTFQIAETQKPGKFHVALGTQYHVDSFHRYDFHRSRIPAPTDAHHIWCTTLNCWVAIHSVGLGKHVQAATASTACTSRDKDIDTFRTSEYLMVHLRSTGVQLHTILYRRTEPTPATQRGPEGVRYPRQSLFSRSR